MAKNTPMLALETDGIRAVRLTESGKDFACDITQAWPFAAVSGEETPEADPAGATEQDSVAVLADIFKAAAKRFRTREIALSLPLSYFITRLVRVPADAPDTLAQAADEALAAASPFPDETLRAGIETVCETDREICALAVALPQAVSQEIADALAAAKVCVTRVDVALLGWLRMLWPRLTAQGAQKRQMVLVNVSQSWDFVVLEAGVPVVMRNLGVQDTAAELGREIILSLLEQGQQAVADEVVVFGEAPCDAAYLERLGAFGPVRTEILDEPFAGAEGCAHRDLEAQTLDATPAAWVEARTETRTQRRLSAALAVAGALWLMVMGVLFGVPFAYDWMRDAQKARSRQQAKAYKDVKDMRDKVYLVRRYSDRARGALEMFKAISDRMPQGITLTAFQYKRGQNVHVTGEAEKPTDVYAFKESFDELAIDETPIFSEVRMPGVSGRGGRNKFDIDATFAGEEDK